MDEELTSMEDTSPENWEWESLRQNLSSHLLVDVNLKTVQGINGDSEVTLENVREYILIQAKEVYKTRESLLPQDIMRGFEKFVVLRTIDEKWKDHLYAMDQLREGINLRAYGHKNPLLEYKSEGFQMFQEMMSNTSEATIQRLYRTQIQGMATAPELPLS